jgi:dihydrofolate reductase
MRKVFVIGGGEIYRHCLENNLVDRVLASEVKGYDEVEGGVFFPDLHALGWKENAVIKDAKEFRVVEYKKS